MTISIADCIETIRIRMAGFLGGKVSCGMPDDSAAGLYVFPYSFSEDLQGRNIPASGSVPQSQPAYSIKCLLIPSPANDYSVLSQGLNWLLANPVLESSGGIQRINMDTVLVEEVTRLFGSAGVPYRLSIPFTIHFTAKA